MEKRLPIFLRFVTFLAIVLSKWFRQRIHPLAHLRRLWSWRSMLQSILLLLVLSCADNLYAQFKATASPSKGTAGARPMPKLPAGVQKLGGQAEAAMRKKAGKALQKAKSTLRFEQNRGQLDNATVLFTAKDEQATHFFTKSEIRSVITGKKDSAQAGYALRFLDANPDVAIAAADKISNSGAINYITDEGSFANVASYSKLNYNSLWKGVDADFYESEGSMKYDFIVQPNADPTQVRLKLDGVTNVKVNAQGELEFTTPFGTLQKGKPYTYQTVNGKKVEISSAYILNDKGEISFQLGDYDHRLPLIIDPIALKWSTFLMAGIDDTTNFYNTLNAIYVHPTTGRIYLVGRTASTSFPNTLGRAYGGTNGSNDNTSQTYSWGDAFVTCMEKDGTSLVWSTYIGGDGADEANAVSVDAAGDVYVAGGTFSGNFPTNGTTPAFDATSNGANLGDLFIFRLNSTGETLKYSTYIGGNGLEGITFGLNSSLVVTDGIVYWGGGTRSTDFPITAGAFQATIGSGGNTQAVLFGLNTNVGGAAGLKFSTFFGAGGRSTITNIKEDKDGNLWLVGYSTLYNPNFPLSANAVQKVGSTGNGTAIYGNNTFVAKFSKSGQYLYSSYVNPVYYDQMYVQGRLDIDIDAQGNVYVLGGVQAIGGVRTQVANITNFYSFGSVSGNYNFVTRIPYDLSPQYDFVSVFPSDGSGVNGIALDKKGNIHLISGRTVAPLTAGNLYGNEGAYYVLSPSGGSVLYGTGISTNTEKSVLFVNDKCEAYVATKFTGSFPVTPTYRDFETNTQKTVYSTVKAQWGLSVFHEPIPNNNTIPDFATGNNTFCVDGAIWQNPNDGPIIGNTAFYTSGDGSLPTHNIPNTTLGAHPIPASPALQYRWQKSLDGGSNWINVGNGGYDVYKPEPEPAAGTVKYRRTILGFCSDTTLSVSNAISATIAGNFTLQIATPTKPVYYCPAVAGTDLGVSVTGASGNISWQWYDGFSPLTGNGIISPSSGTGTMADFTAQVGTLVSSGGFYRLIITDAGGCRKEAFVSISPKTASAGLSPTVALCPGSVISVKIGPSAINPDFDYLWTGPSGYTSTSPNPTVTTAGTYTLKVKVKTDATYCSPGTTVVVTASTPFASSLTNITNKTFCQDDTPAAIGLTGTPPAGYVFQWVPGTNLDDQQAYSPKYDPGNVPGGPPVGITNYTFTALRQSDGCVFERTMTVTNTALAFAFAGSDRIGDGCTTGTRDQVGGEETTGLYFQWTAIKTDFTAGLASLKANAAFGMDALGQQVGTNKLLNAKFPLCSANGNKGYYIDYELKASYAPFSNSCFTADTVRVFIPCCGDLPVCPEFTSNFKGTTGVCSGATTQLSINPIQGATYVWTTYSVNGVIQPAGTAPKGLFVNNNGVKGAPISGSGPHPTSVIVDFDNAAWGWSGNNVVVYEVTQTYDLGNGIGNGPLTCMARQQVFSGLNGTPKIGVLDLAICTIPSPGTRVGTTGNAGPYTLTGANYTQAPNSAFNWAWTLVDGPPGITGGGTTPFPTFNPPATTSYQVTVKDPATGCIARDTLVVKVKPVIADAGLDLSNICPGSLVQLGTTALPGLSYTWTPSAGLNFPIGTPNNTVAQPYLTVPGPAPATLTYTLNVIDAESGCQATNAMTIGVTSTAPPAIAPATYNNCANGILNIGPAGSLAGATYAWTVQSGSADLAWLSSTSVRNPTVTLPADFNGPAVFRLTVTKGTCGSVFADYTITNTYPAINLGGPYTAACTSPFTQIGETALTGYSYTWIPYTGLYSNSVLTTAYSGENLSRVWTRPTETTTYTLIRKNDANGCEQTATVVVNPPAGVAVNAGADKAWCPGSLAIPIGATGSGTLTWTAIGYTASLSAATPSAIASGMTSGQMLGYLSSTSGAVVNFVQSTPVSGQYVYRLTSTANGCSIFDDVIVRVSPVVTGIAGLGQNVCLGGAVQLGATTNPTSLNYLWTALNPSNAGNTISDATAARPFVTPTVNTTYQVTYTDPITGCPADEQVTVVVNPFPAITVVPLPAACQPIAAQDLTSLISNYATLSNPVWYKDQYPGGVVVTTPTAVSVSQTTTYILVVTNDLGCKATAEVVITISTPKTPAIAASGSLNCTTRTFDLASVQGTPSVAGNTLEWHSANNTNANTLITNLSVGVGKYYLFEKAAGSANCYSASDSITISSDCPVVCTLTLKPTVSGCYQNAGSSKATVSIEVSWENATISPTANDSTDAITVTFGGQTKIINPGAYTSTGGNGTIVSPQVVAFELTADASTQIAQAFIGASYAASTCKVEKTGIVLPAACVPVVCIPGQTGGTVWNDFNADGIKQPGETTGIAGVTVNAYDCKGVLIASTTTDASGKYVFTNIPLPSYPIRVEFVNLPAYAGQGTMNGTDGRTTVQFVNAADCNVDLGILDNADYCQTNPKIVVPCYVNGDPLVAGTSAGSNAVVSFDYSASGLQNTAIMAHAPASEVGALWGMAYNKYTKKIFSSATVKRHVGLGPLGLGGIYAADFSTVPANGSTFAYSNFIDVSTIGINVGIIASNSVRGLVGDRTQPSVDNEGYLKVGKAGIGGIDLSEDGNTLYFTNLFDNKLYAIDITAYNTSGTLPTSANVKSYDMSNGINCTGGDLHTWGVKVHKGKVYTGMVCDAGVSQNKSDLRAYVQELNGTTVSTIFDFPLSYPKGFPNWGDTTITGWYPWTDNWASKILPANPLVLTHPEPIFSSIEFDIDGSMILAFGDRTGIQTGLNNYNPNGNDGKSYSSALGGDILRAYSNGTSFVLENNAKAGPNVGYGANNNQGPGFGEFYNDNLFFEGTRLGHAENAIGGLALRAGSGEVIEIAMDPLDAPVGADGGLYFNAGGLRHLNNTSGLTTQSYIIYNGLTPGAQGKASGLGDAVLLCDVPTYLEIGNRVWNDANKNGVQDPCEKVLTGVNVSLYQGATLVATTKTDVNGEYYFSTKSKIGTGTWSGTGADTTLSPTTGYKLVFGAGQTTGGALTVAGLGQFILTVKDATANNGNDQNDSDAEVLSGAFCINLTTGALASVNHTFDVGFICTNPAIKATFSQTAPTCTATTENNNGKVTLTAGVTPYDKFRVKLSTATWGADSSYATATAIGSTFPKDLVTTAPNAGATYVVRFYTGECCFKDTTIIVLPTPCVVGSIGDYVWKDANRNGKQDGTETGVNGVQVILWSATTTGTPIAKLDSMTTAGAGANAGKYLFSNLPKGDYVVQFVKSTIPAECSGFTAKDTTAAGTTDKNDSDADKTTGITAKITLDPKVLSGTSSAADSLATNNLTVDAGLVAPLGSIGDYVWKDADNDGVQDATEAPVAGVIIQLLQGTTVIATDTTDAAGLYLFPNLSSGSYQVKILTASLPAGCTLSTKKDLGGDDTKDSDFDPTTGLSQTVTIDAAGTGIAKDNLTVDGALYSPKGSIGDYVWKDANNDGIQDATEAPVAGVIVQLLQGTTLVSTDTTNAAGLYLFPNLSSGSYQVKILTASLPAGCTLSTKKDLGGDDTKDSDFDPTTGLSQTVTIDALGTGIAKDNLTVDGALYSPKGSIGDYVWKDADNDGVQDATEAPVAGVIVQLLQGTTVVATDTTNAAGLYLFPNLSSGSYQVKILTASLPAGCTLSTQKDLGGDDTKDSDFDPTTGLSQTVTIDAAGTGIAKDNLTVDGALYSPKGSIGDYVWKDADNDGVQDASEAPVAGVIVQLLQGTTVLATDTTNAAGLYLFPNLSSGTYQVKILTASLPAGCTLSTKKDLGGDDTKDSDFDPTTGLSQTVTIDAAGTGIAKDNLTVDAALAVPCVKSKVALVGTPACSADVQTYSLTFSVTNKLGIVKVDKGTLTGSNPYTVTGIPSGTTLKITDSLSALCKSDTLITGPNCNCNPTVPTLITPSLTACIGDTFPTLKATVTGLATVEWFATATSTTVLSTGLSYKPAGTLTAAGATFYAQARSTDPSCPAAISTSRVMATVNAQNCNVIVDLALKKSINTKIAQIGDLLTYTLKVWNESATNATGVEVTDSIATTVQFQAGSFTASRGSASISGNVIKWVIGSIAAAGVPANGDTVTLTYRVKATQEGVHFNTAEISKVNEKDVDSTPGNGKEGEDDIDRQCFTVPVKLCPGEKAEVNVPANLTNVQWFKNGGTTAIGSGNVILLSEVGTYTFTATNQTCPANGCCPVIIEPGINCCPEDLCIPFTIKQTKKGKK